LELQLYGFSQVELYSDIQKIRAQGFDSSRLWEYAIYLAELFGPRLSGTEACNNATEWTVKTLNSTGLANVEMKPWGEFGKGWQVEKFYIAQTTPYYQPLVAAPRAWTGNTNGLVNASVEIVRASTMKELQMYRGKLNGKLIIQPFEEELEVSFVSYTKRFTEKEIVKMMGLQEVKPEPIPFYTKKTSNSRTGKLPFSVLRDFFGKVGAIAVLSNSGTWGVVRSYGDRLGRSADSLGLPDI